ncbi:cysteine dioxygenase family protein [Aeromicrobium sp. YIM 150415]|uniref:cysteine dioxygenase n=1 Tax=Aeromicrobium sp. YIM 150415 TaxID=2803912 RepID=UPI001963092E|nr:cysteine dioxygenase family protein [Aeromicrobium sp. YIM 150415]MBM9465092.1 cysteine dioxygenase family protein [Aeromicrobium sp. YIM 150415]
MPRRRITAPALDLPALVELVECVADEVRAGVHEVHADPDERWHVRVHADDQVDVWLISWTRDQGTQLHDHGESSGAFTVVEGSLDEAVWEAGTRRLTETARSVGDSVVFGERYVHDVRNRREETAVSVHAYSPPLRQMSYYEVRRRRLVTLAHSWTDDPEAPPPAHLRRAS